MINWEVYQEIRAECEIAGVEFMVVSKNQSLEDVLALIETGHKLFGENRLQESTAKYNTIRERVELHMIGNLQSNKVTSCLDFFDTIQSIGSDSSLTKLVESGVKGRAFLQVNIGDETQKKGFTPEISRQILQKHEGIFAGVMCIPPKGNTEAFDTLKSLADEFGLKASMGMSSDWRVAIEKGSNMIRVGSILFKQA